MTDWVIDLDGVMWRGQDPVAGSVEAVATLLARGDRVLFCTNNSTGSGAARAAQLVAQGITPGVEVVTSADAVCTLTEPGERVLVFGSPGLAEVLADHGADVVRTVEAVAQNRAFGAVVVGLTRDFDYPQLDLVSQVVRRGARLLATNDDATFPAAGRIQPGTGSILAAVEAACGLAATVAGKPNAPMAHLIADRLGGDRPVVVVGDRPDTDGRLAQALGAPFALVLSGVTESAGGSPDVPVATVADDLTSLVAIGFGAERLHAPVERDSAVGTTPVHR